MEESLHYLLEAYLELKENGTDEQAEKVKNIMLDVMQSIQY